MNFARLRVLSSTSSSFTHHFLKSFQPQLLSQQTIHSHFHTTTFKMAPSATEKPQAKSSGSNSSDVEGEQNEWKFRAPYKVHENKDGGGFNTLYEASCHCGRVKYQLSREKPLDAKYCHCTTCQVLHGSFLPFYAHSPSRPSLLAWY